MKLEIMKTDNIRKAPEKKTYFSPVIECIKLDNEISLVLNSFNGLPGDPKGDGCSTNDSEQIQDSPW